MLEDEKKLFAERLNYALNLLKIPEKGKGRLITVAKAFDISPNAASKWLEGLAFPEITRLPFIAKQLNVNLEWLAFGIGSSDRSLPESKKIPIIDWNEIDYFLYSKNEIVKSKSYIFSNSNNFSDFTYALKVREDDDSLEPQFYPGAILVVDPERRALHKALMVFKWENTQDIKAMQMLINGPKKYLNSYNPTYTPIELDENNPVTSLGRVMEIIVPMNPTYK